MALDTLAAGLFLGLSSGVQCTVTCLPLLLTQLTGGNRTARDSMRISVLFSLGRLVVYFTLSVLLYFSFRAFSGALGNPIPESLTTTLMGAILIYYCFRALSRKKDSSCAAKPQAKLIRIPFTSMVVTPKPGRNWTTLFLGIVSSMNVCLPLVALISISVASDLVSTFSSVTLFWMGSSVYSFGLALALAGVSRVRIGAALSRRVGFIGSLSGVLLGAFLLFAGLTTLTIV
jgi:hypothetical protein